MAEGKLLWQIGPRAFYAEVTVESFRAADGEVCINVAKTSDPTWEAGARFGIAVLLGKLRGGPSVMGGLTIDVVQIKGQPVDTTAIAVAYAAYHALRQSLHLIEPFQSAFRFENDTGDFIISPSS